MEFLEKLIAPLISALFGAVLAFRYQRNNELKRDKRIILQNLMMYRNVGAEELNWINSINVIEIVYYNNKKVRMLYHKFLAHVQPDLFETKQHVEIYYEMVLEMCKCVGYTNLELTDIREMYSPIALSWHYPKRTSENEPPKKTEE